MFDKVVDYCTGKGWNHDRVSKRAADLIPPDGSFQVFRTVTGINPRSKETVNELELLLVQRLSTDHAAAVNDYVNGSTTFTDSLIADLYKLQDTSTEYIDDIKVIIDLVAMNTVFQVKIYYRKKNIYC